VTTPARRRCVQINQNVQRIFTIYLIIVALDFDKMRGTIKRSKKKRKVQE